MSTPLAVAIRVYGGVVSFLAVNGARLAYRTTGTGPPLLAPECSTPTTSVSMCTALILLGVSGVIVDMSEFLCSGWCIPAAGR